MPSANWKKLTFGECVTLRSGGTPSKSNPAYWKGSIPWVSCKDMKVSRIHDSEDHVTEKGAENGTRVVPKGTILIVVRGMILAKEFPVAIAQRPVTFNQDLKAIECNESVDASFFYYWLLANAYEVKGIADEAAHGTKRLQTDRLLKLPLDVPSLALQRKIASILSAYDDLIENNTRRIAILEAMAQALYREWFVEFRFPGHENVKLVNSPLGKIPEGWKPVKVEDAIFINPRTTVPREGEKPFVSMGAVPHNTMLIDVAATETRTGNSGSKFQNDDTLFARITPCLENGKTAFVQFLPTPEAVAFGSTEFIVLRSKTVCPEFVYLLARSDAFRDNAIKSMSGATGRQRVQEKCFDNFFFAHPDTKSLSAFADFMRPLFKNVFALSKKNANLRKTRDLLLPKLISGQLDVEDLDIETGEAVTE